MPVFLLLGFFYAAPQIALRNSANIGATAALIWFAVSMMHIESTIGTIFGGLLQQLLVLAIVWRLLNVRGRTIQHSATQANPLATAH
jgi:hypothetical protein